VDPVQPDEPALEHVLGEAAAGRLAVAGLADTLEAVAWGTVCRLYVDRGFRATGSACGHCGVLQADEPAPCPLCGRLAEPVELGAALVEQVRAAGGSVDVVEGHAALAARGGIAACVRHVVPHGRQP